MTDEELKAKILAEIERLQAKEFNNFFARHERVALDKVKNFINSLPEEPVTGDLKKEIESYCLKHGYISEGVFGYTLQEQVGDIAKYFYNLGRQKEDPVNEPDWLRELQDKLDNATPEQLQELWDKYHDDEDDEDPVGDDLKEAADNALESITDQYDIISVGSCLEMFKLGAKWQKQETINRAVEWLKENSSQFPYYLPDPDNNKTIRVNVWDDFVKAIEG